MKKIRVLVLILTIVVMSTYCFATVSSEHIYEYSDENITVIFQENTAFTSEEQVIIADKIVYGYDNDENISTYSLCWLTGHETSSEMVTSVQHKVSSSSPRCVKTMYTVTTCSKCDYEEIETLGSGYIYCCPEEGASAVSE